MSTIVGAVEDSEGVVTKGFEVLVVVDPEAWRVGWPKGLLAVLVLLNGLLGFLSVGSLASGCPSAGTAWLAVFDWAGCTKPGTGCTKPEAG